MEYTVNSQMGNETAFARLQKNVMKKKKKNQAH